jgi:hypothetical protein
MTALIFSDQDRFIRWLKLQDEENFSYSFEASSHYPIAVNIERKPNRVTIKEVPTQ